jgi:sugar phosphate permease
MLVMSTAILGGVVHPAPLISDKGLGPVVARVGLGFLLDKLFAPLVSLVAFLVEALGFALIIYYRLDSAALVLLASFLLGMSTGAEGDLIPYLIHRYFGKHAFGSIYGCLFGAATLGGAIGPLVYGAAFDALKSYGHIHRVSMIACVAGTVAMLLMGRYPARFLHR